MAGERRSETGPQPGKAPQGATRPIRRPTPEEVDSRGDELFKESIAGLSQRLGERAAQQSDPRAEAEARRVALRAYELARRRRLKWGFGAGAAMAAAAAIASFVVAIGAPPAPAIPDRTANMPQAPAVETAALVPAPTALPANVSPVDSSSSLPAPAVDANVAASSDVASAAPTRAAPVDGPSDPAPPQAASMVTLPNPAAVQSDSAPVTPIASSPPFDGVETASVETDAAAPAEPVYEETPLRPDEVREVQERLQTFGFNPGPFDGTAGPMTTGAAMHYQQDRGRLQSGKIDRTLLDELRQDPAPKVAQRRVRHDYYRAARSTGARRADLFAPLRTASVHFSQWLQSLTR